MPSDINYRANIAALKEEGCTHLIATTACGSLKEEFKPGDIVFPDQFIDRTTKRLSTFYDGKPRSPVGICHMPMHEPYCGDTRKVCRCVEGLKMWLHTFWLDVRKVPLSLNPCIKPRGFRKKALFLALHGMFWPPASVFCSEMLQKQCLQLEN